TLNVSGSTTDISSDLGPILQLHDGCNAVSPSRLTHSIISSSVCTSGPGEISPPLKGSNAFCDKMFLATLTASTHSRSSSLVDNEVYTMSCFSRVFVDLLFSSPRELDEIGPTCT